MFNPQLIRRGVPTILLALLALPAAAQSFRVQCPTHTTLHPLLADGSANPHIKCQQISGGDGFATMGDGTQTYMFSFGPLSGLADIVNGLPGTETAAVFNQNNLDPSGNVLDAVKIGAPDGASYPFNGAIGLVPDVEAQNGNIPPQPTTGPDSHTVAGGLGATTCPVDRSRRPAPRDGCRCDERQHSGADDRDRRGR